MVSTGRCFYEMLPTSIGGLMSTRRGKAIAFILLSLLTIAYFMSLILDQPSFHSPTFPNKPMAVVPKGFATPSFFSEHDSWYLFKQTILSRQSYLALLFFIPFTIRKNICSLSLASRHSTVAWILRRKLSFASMQGRRLKLKSNKIRRFMFLCCTVRLKSPWWENWASALGMHLASLKRHSTGGTCIRWVKKRNQ